MVLTILIIICIAGLTFCFIKLIFEAALKTKWLIGVVVFGFILVLSYHLKVVNIFSDLLTDQQMGETTTTTMITTTTTTFPEMTVYVCGKCGEAKQISR